MIILGVPIGIFIFLFSNKIIKLIYGNQFDGAVIILQILIFSCIIIFIRSPFERVLESSNRQFSITKIFIIALLINIALNLIVIPKYNYIGAAIITVVTDLIVFCLLIYITRDFKILKSKMSLWIIKIFVASVIMELTLIYLNQLNIFYLIVIGALIYIFQVFIFKIIGFVETLFFFS